MKAQVRRLTMIAGLLAAVAPAVATAQGASGREYELWTPYGEYFLMGGGVTKYFNGTVKNLVDTGGTWDLRVGLGSRFFMGGELAYVGSASKANAIGTNLLTNGVEAVVRVQYPYETGQWLIEPFAFGGGGWTHFDIRHAHGPAIQDDRNDLFVLPLGGGLTVGYGPLRFDTRFTYRQTFSDSLVRAADGTSASLKSWAITTSAGYEF